MKHIVIAGGITRDAVTRTTQGGDKVTGFSVAVSEGFGNDKRTLYFDCSMWGARGEKLAGFLGKGVKVAVSGEMSTREHDGKTYLTIRVADVTLQGGGERREEQREERQSGYGAGGRPSDDLGDEVPFAAEWRA